ncbi:lantibiotic dehydratase C-terminal domain-containing protein, partial [Streptomyces bambusae]
ASTRAAVAALRALGRAPRPDRLALALDAAHTTAYALGMDREAAGGWLRAHAAGWRWVADAPLLPGAVVHTRVNTVFAGSRQVLTRRADALRERLARGTAAAWQTEWAAAVTAADKRLRAHHEHGLPWVWASQLHMLLNRLGIGPDEERAVCRLAARTLLEADGPYPFFDGDGTEAGTGPGTGTGTGTDGADEDRRGPAPDRRYLEHSKFHIGAMRESAARPVAAPPAAAEPGPYDLPLPAGPLPDVPLAAVLAARASAGGRVGGPLAAAAVGTL